MLNYRSRVAPAILLLSAALSLAVEPAVRVEQGWIQAVPPVSSDSVAYMNLQNLTGGSLKLTAASTSAAEMVMPMVTTREMKSGRELVGMKPVSELEIPAHGQLVLAPGGPHLMLMHLKKPVRPGDRVRLTLHFEPGGIVVTTDLLVAFRKP